MAQTEEASDFKYIVRIANTDLDGERPLGLALTSIKGIGRRTALSIIRATGLDPRMRIGDISEEQEELLKKEIGALSGSLPVWFLNRRRDYDTGEDIHLVGTDLDTVRKDDINRMKKIRCYRGIRHETGQKVRGQRTRSNGRTGLTLGVSRKRK
ncbi:MAG: 30S ribosomal protein S13 [Thermoplasmata archaeon]|nr:30S ribosomal protein S13 [Thermoplasmata archaeon]